jgi:hypothetical protein
VVMHIPGEENAIPMLPQAPSVWERASQCGI